MLPESFDGRDGFLEGQWGPQGRNDSAERLTRHPQRGTPPPPVGSLFLMAVLVGWMYRPSFTSLTSSSEMVRWRCSLSWLQR